MIVGTLGFTTKNGKLVPIVTRPIMTRENLKDIGCDCCGEIKNCHDDEQGNNLCDDCRDNQCFRK